MTTTELFLVAMLIIFSLPWLLWRLGRTDRYAPLVVVQILVGVLLGPGVAGAAFPELHATLFNPQVITALNGIAWWGVMLLVFIVGVELDVKAAWEGRHETGITAACALITPFLFGAGAAAILLASSDGWAGPNASTPQVIAGIGMGCAVTALPVLVLLMERLGIMRQPIGQRLLRYASLDDVAIWAMLAIILVDTDRLVRQLLFLVGFVVAARLLRALMSRIPERDRWHVALVWLILLAFAADWSGLHYMVGAFLAGVVCDARWFNRERLEQFRQQVLFLVVPVYFLSTGLRTEWDMGGQLVLGAAALLLLASVAGKLAGAHLAGRLLGWARGEASYIGWLLQTKGLVEIIFAQVLLDRGIISGAAFTALLLMAVGSTLLTIPVVSALQRRSLPAS
jgi:Kef-type K+ transport system membrane component KefB